MAERINVKNDSEAQALSTLQSQPVALMGLGGSNPSPGAKYQNEEIQLDYG